MDVETMEDGQVPSPRSRRGLVLGLALFTLVAFGGTGLWLIAGVQKRPLTQVILGDLAVRQHALLGLGMGLLISAGGWWIIARPFLAPVRSKYAALIGPLMPQRWLQWLVSVCAGVGEELFFRGALQHWLGIPLTAIGFVALHGYLDPRSARVSIYGIYLTVTMMGLGWYANSYGLLGPIVAHIVIDLVLIGKLVEDWKKINASPG